MKAARQFGIVLLLLVSYLTPAMACMVSNVQQMNAEERACCRAMKNQCEQMGMSSSHGCCQKAPKSTQENAIASKSVSYHPIAVAIVWLSTMEWPNLNRVIAGAVEYADTSPPPAPPGSISILRI